jgi:hypothetical protein
MATTPASWDCRPGSRRRWASWSGAAKDGLLALSVGVGLGVLSELMEEEVDDVVGPKGKRNPGRSAVRHGHEAGEVTLGGRRVAVQAAGSRRSVRGRGPPTASTRCVSDVCALRRPRPADPGRVGADSGRRLDPQVRPHPRAGRPGTSVSVLRTESGSCRLRSTNPENAEGPPKRAFRCYVYCPAGASCPSGCTSWSPGRSAPGRTAPRP